MAFFPTDTINCKPGFQPIQGGCFLVNTTKQYTWHQAFNTCLSMEARLAIIDREGLRRAMTEVLTNMCPTPNTLFIGLVVQGNWDWVDGSRVNSSIWMPTYPRGSSDQLQCAVLPPSASQLKNAKCRENHNFVCQTKERKISY